MAINKINLSQLSHCNQYWDEMPSIKGGRLCAQCDRCIVDFRNKTPHEIAVMHAYKTGALCGIYSEEQLGGGKMLASKSRFAYAKSLLMGIGVLSSAANLLAQTNESKPNMEVVEIKTMTVDKSLKTESKQDSAKMEVAANPFLISGKVVDAKSNEALIGVTLWIKDTEIGVATNIEGRFELDLKEQMPFIEKKDSVVLVVSYIGFNTQEIPIDLTVNQLQNMRIELDNEGIEIIEFY
ncbi:MAG: carboxypeptidase-like regulatory domain-containing protein [Chitinophagales bacterium]